MVFAGDQDKNQRLLGDLSKWVLLFAGVALLAMGMLTGPWLEVCRLRADRDLMRNQAKYLLAKAVAHERLAAAIADRDPTVVQGLAYQQLGITPAGVSVVPTEPPTVDRGGWALEQWLMVPGFGRQGMQSKVAAYGQESLMVRLTDGSGRLWVSGSGLLCVLAGVWGGIGDGGRA